MIGNAREERVFARANGLLKSLVSVHIDAGFPYIAPRSTILVLKSRETLMRSLFGLLDGVCLRRS